MNLESISTRERQKEAALHPLGSKLRRWISGLCAGVVWIFFIPTLKGNEPAHGSTAHAPASPKETSHGTPTESHPTQPDDHGAPADKKDHAKPADAHASAAEHGAAAGKTLATDAPKTHGHAAKDPDPLISYAEPSQLVKILEEQIDYQPIDVLQALVDKILKLSPPHSKDATDAMALMRQVLLKSARRAVELENHSEAMLLYERWRAHSLEQDDIDPVTGSVLIEMGREYRQVGSSLTAIETFYRAMTHARQGAPNSDILRVARWEVAETTYMMKNWDRARRLYEMFIDNEDGKHILAQSAYYRIGDCWKALGDETQMTLAYERALANNPKHPYAPEARLAILESFLKRGNQAVAMKVLGEFVDSIKTMPGQDAFHWKRRSGELLFRHHFENQKYDQALQILETLEKMDPKSEAWQRQMAQWKGLVFIQQKQWAKATESLAEKPKSPTPGETQETAQDPSRRPLEVAVPDSRFHDLSLWINHSEKRKSDLGLPTSTLNSKKP